MKSRTSKSTPCSLPSYNAGEKTQGAESAAVSRSEKRSSTSFNRILDLLPFRRRRAAAVEYPRLPAPSPQSLERSLGEQPFDRSALQAEIKSHPQADKDTVLYLAYGSNLCAETFRGKRGIKPLAQVNVVVPELRLTFDLPGIPYAEPCFANSGLRDPSNPSSAPGVTEKTRLLQDAKPPRYHKDRWHKGLVGVVYEVTKADYAHIIATEGGGASYHDILVDCYPLLPIDTVPEVPDTKVFKAHTLFAPATVAPNPGDPPPKEGGRFQRPDPSYAQPSARYKKLITDGADECELPQEYKTFLHGIRPYTITTPGQQVGQFVYLAIWGPIVAFIFGLQKQFQDDKGNNPAWLIQLLSLVFRAAWTTYDLFFKPLFGDGERTIHKDGDDEEEDSNRQSRARSRNRTRGARLGEC